MHILLNCDSPAELVTIDTKSLKEIDSSEIHISSESRLFENGWYSATVNIPIELSEITRVQLFLNGSLIGWAYEGDLESTKDGTYASITFQGGRLTAQPFLLQYDLVQLSVSVEQSEGGSSYFVSDYYLCISKNEHDTENLKAIIEALLVFDDSKISHWIFASSQAEMNTNSLTEGSWRDRSYKSLHSYLQIINEVYNCYKNNLAYFKTLAKHNIIKRRVLRSYENVRSVQHKDFAWLMQNADQLVQTSQKTALSYNGLCYLPYQITTEENSRNLDVYENQVVVSFLHLVYSHVKNIEKELGKSITNELLLLERLQGLEQGGYKAPILTVKRFQVNLHRVMLEKINHISRQMQAIYTQYTTILPCKQAPLLHFPRKTKTFQEIRPYTYVFEQIVHWFRYGEFDLRKENVILRIKTINKLFEYYCLHRVLQMVINAGFDIDDPKQAIYSYEYNVADPRFINEHDIANTFVLSKGDTTVTVYYQPVIHTARMENNIMLFRTTDQSNYFVPDLLLKITRGDTGISNYVLFDCKYSTRQTIQEYEMEREILRYSCQIADTFGRSNAVKMMWLLQGRVDGTPTISTYHNSPLARRYPPFPSYGIFSVNTHITDLRGLWKEITSSTKLN